MELNEGIRLLTGNAKIDIPLVKRNGEKPAPTPPTAAVASPAVTGPVTTRCTVDENGRLRTFVVTVEPITAAGGSVVPGTATAAPATGGTAVFSSFAGSVEVVDILVKVGDTVRKGQVLAAVEAMKAKHEIKSPRDGSVSAVHIKVGDEVDSSKPLITIV